MTALSSVTKRQLVPNASAGLYVLTYSKANVGDFLTLSGIVPQVVSAKFYFGKTAANVADVMTISSGVISGSAGTGASQMILVGIGQ